MIRKPNSAPQTDVPDSTTAKQKARPRRSPHYRTALQAIRAKCLDCSCHQTKEIRLCPILDCALWPYRMGKRPAPEQGV